MQIRPVVSGAQRGFTLIELLIVIAIIGIVAAIALPSLLRSRISANEAAAIATLRAIIGANTDYNNNTIPHSYASDLGRLVNGTGAGGIPFLEGWNVPDGVNDVVRSGYYFMYEQPLGRTWSYWVTAQPRREGSSGVRHFFINQAGVVCVSEQNQCLLGSSIAAIPCGSNPGCQPLQ